MPVCCSGISETFFSAPGGWICRRPFQSHGQTEIGRAFDWPQLSSDPALCMCACSPAKGILRWATQRLPAGGEALQVSSPGRGRDNQPMPEPKERHVSVKKITAVDAGIGHFPKQESAGAPISNPAFLLLCGIT